MGFQTRRTLPLGRIACSPFDVTDYDSGALVLAAHRIVTP
jgi:hypothetical protein